MKKTNSKNSFILSFLKDKTDFTSKFLKLILYPAILVLLAVIFLISFGFNSDNSLRNQQILNIEFKTTITAQDFTDTTNEVSKILTDNGFKPYQFDRESVDTVNAKLIVRIVCDNYDDTDIVSKLSDVHDEINTYVLSNFADAEVTEFEHFQNVSTNLVKNIGLTILFFAIFAFIYAWIRIEIVSAFAIFANVVYVSLLLLSAILAFRIPVSELTGVAVVVTLIITTLYSYTLMLKIKALQYNDNFKANLNKEYVKSAIISRIEPIYVLSLSLMSALIIAMIVSFFIVPSFAFTLLLCVLGILFAFYSSLYIGTSIWSLLYKRSKNKRIAFYKNLLEKREERKKSNKKDDEEKLIV